MFNHPLFALFLYYFSKTPFKYCLSDCTKPGYLILLSENKKIYGCKHKIKVLSYKRICIEKDAEKHILGIFRVYRKKITEVKFMDSSDSFGRSRIRTAQNTGVHQNRGQNGTTVRWMETSLS